jgi:glycosyltransferase involved in cell wall biosynthesis
VTVAGGRPTVAVAFHEEVIGGSAIGWLRILPLLEERGWNFTFWTPGPGPLRDDLEGRGYRVAGVERLHRYSLSGLRVDPGPAARLRSIPGYLGQFRRWLRDESPALLHANTLIMLPEAIVARASRQRVFLYVHEILPQGAKGAVAARLIRAASHDVLTNSKTALEALHRAGVRAEMAYYGTEMPAQPARRSPDRPLVVGVLGNVSRRKGTDVFVAAAERVRRELPDVELRIVGPCPDGPERPWAEQLLARAQEIGIRHSVTSDPYSELADWGLLVLPSRSEAFGIVLAEAGAMELPVVASRIDGPREIVTPETGVLVDVDDVAGFADAILELARDPARRERMGAAGRARVAATFTLEAQAEAVDRAYRRCARFN